MVSEEAPALNTPQLGKKVQLKLYRYIEEKLTSSGFEKDPLPADKVY